MSSPQQAPTGYQVTGQPGADQAYQTGASQLANAGTALYNTVAPQLSTAATNITNNPYNAQALAGAQTASSLATGQVAPSQLAAMGQLGGAASGALGTGAADSAGATAVGAQALGQTQALQPVATSGIPYAQPMLQQAESYIPATTNPELNAGQQVLQTAFDPQSALYNQQYQQMLDQQNAINAMSGVSGSPYGAGITGNAAQNFDLNWQNQQLNRQISGLGAYDSAASTAANNLSTLQSTGVNDFNSLLTSGINNATNLINTGTGAYYGGISTGANALASLTNAATSADLAADQIGTDAINTEVTGAQLPADVYNQQQQNALAAATAQAQGTDLALNPTQQAITDQGAYLNIGTNEAQQATNAAQANNQAAAASAAGFGSLAGSVLGMFSFSPIKL